MSTVPARRSRLPWAPGGSRCAPAATFAATLAAVALFALAGCAVPPQPGSPLAAPRQASPPPPPVPTAEVPLVPGLTPAAEAVDSGPSDEALEVLESIPEPVEEEREIPIPSATQPLGDATLSDSIAAPDSAGVAADSAAAAPAHAPDPPPTSSPAAPSTPPAQTRSQPSPADHPAPSGPCWRVQFAAPDNTEEAEQMRSAVKSLLDVVASVEPEGGRYKVRSADCLDREGSERLRSRAASSGFEGAFLVPVAKR